MHAVVKIKENLYGYMMMMILLKGILIKKKDLANSYKYNTAKELGKEK